MYVVSEYEHQRCTDTNFNICILSVCVKNYLYPFPISSDVNCNLYPIHIRGSIMVQLQSESKNFFASSYVGGVF